MYLVTNRKLLTGKKGLELFGKDPSEKGPMELRLVKVTRKQGQWTCKVEGDELPKSEVIKLKNKYGLSINEKENWHASLKIACEIFARAVKEKKSILFFVHGYNNDVKDVLTTAQQIEKAHNVIVVPFTWPANGGGAVSGTLSYKSDKSDARASEGALDRFIGKIQFFHHLLVEGGKAEAMKKAHDKFPDNPVAAQSMYSRLIAKKCQTGVSLLCHSMGNYVFKKTLGSSGSSSAKLVFDNICLVAADTNNSAHSVWVDKLDVRKRVYIVINENDYALKASRIKPGDEQKARLGHFLKGLNSETAYYIDVTKAKLVGSDHSYFVGGALNNKKIKWIFSKMFKGETVEERLNFDASRNLYQL
ncbi:alpha/beta hydrolase [Aliikangiella sp. G2MR2-5]|uniref:alpha/beta hydrolase n=1 Tax=Aliikangiella sp. G2MR2-5 TaxID=2788943 RepID=UPI0018AB1796|nr:alpha/beta hydrolase [Aliikangiella sp. G2MR2-5]